MMLGVSSMDCAMVTEFRGDHSDTDPIDFLNLYCFLYGISLLTDTPLRFGLIAPMFIA